MPEKNIERLCSVINASFSRVFSANLLIMINAVKNPMAINIQSEYTIMGPISNNIGYIKN